MESSPLPHQEKDLHRVALIFQSAGCTAEPNYALNEHERLVMSGSFLLWAEDHGSYAEDDAIEFAIYFEDGVYKGQVDNRFDDIGPEPKITKSFPTMDEAAGFIIGEIDTYLNSGAY